MHTPAANPRTAGSHSGVIDTLSAGYATVNRQLWILLLPILVDLFLWQGPQVSLAPLLQPLLVRSSEIALQADASLATAAASDDGAVEYRQVQQALMARADATNALTLLAWGPLGLPSVIAVIGGVGPYSFVHGWVDGALLLAGASTASLVIGGLFRGLLALRVRDDSGQVVRAVHQLPAAIARIMGLLVVLFLAGIAVGLPALVFVGLVSAAVPVAASLGILLLSVAVVWAEVHLFFASDAIFVSNANPLDAIRRSVRLVRRHSWPVLGFILLTWLILAGMERLWAFVAANLAPPLGLALGILGNAYIATGLVAASMIFYKDRAASPIDRALVQTRATA